ncbi:MAG: hypothetical protein NZM38_09180 [Cytophagales bacterium]|nr:hypothetical protein [Cytophagales bacterium]MDW8384931.1 hypothetical protein [Flammeovirgaceae bacterium]
MVKGCWLLIGLFILQACRNPYIKQDPPELFSTTDDSELYFKNVRQIFYYRTTDTTQREFFRIKSMPQNNNVPLIGLCIVNHWKADKAFLLLEPNGWFVSEDSIEVLWHDAQNPLIHGKIFFEQGPIYKHYFFALEIYRGILKEYKFEVRQRNRKAPFLEDEEAREAFRITVKDFLKLINQLEESEKILESSP